MGLISSIFAYFQKSGPDESVLVQIKKAGSDLSKPHSMEFFIYFPTQSAAQKAALQIQEKGFGVEVKQAAQGKDWLCFAKKKMIPALPVLQQIRRDFEGLAVAGGGQYDGWGTQLVK